MRLPTSKASLIEWVMDTRLHHHQVSRHRAQGASIVAQSALASTFGRAVRQSSCAATSDNCGGRPPSVISLTSDKKPDENRTRLEALAAQFGRTASLAAHYVACTSIVAVPRYDTVLSAKFHFGEVILGK
jgi:hypothetical protein